jgi:hypothetical protein
VPEGSVGYDQMYSSAIAPSRHLATVTMRPPPSNSPMTQVHSPEPNAIGCALIWGGVPPAVSRILALPVDQHVVGVVVREDAVPVGVVPSVEVKVIHALEVASYLVVVHQPLLPQVLRP